MSSDNGTAPGKKQMRPNKCRLGIEVLSTGQVGDLVGANRRTVCNWMDAGVLRGYRLPTGSRDRRFHREDVVAFLRANNYPVPPELDDGPRLLLVGVEPVLAAALAGPNTSDARTAFEAGVDWARHRPAVVVVDVSWVGATESRALALAIRREPSPPRLVALLPADRPPQMVEGFDAVLCQPCEAVDVLREVTP